MLGRTMSTNVGHTMNTTLSSNNSNQGGRIEYQNGHYHDGVGYVHSSSRAPLMYGNHDNVPTTSTSGVAVRQSINRNKPKVHNGPQVVAARQDSSSFGSGTRIFSVLIRRKI